jgi:hypothetical protein
MMPSPEEAFGGFRSGVALGVARQWHAVETPRGLPLKNVPRGRAALGCLSGKMAGKRRGGRGPPCAAGANS